MYIFNMYIFKCVCVYIYIFNSYSLKLCHEFQNSNTITLMLTFYLCHFFINATTCIYVNSLRKSINNFILLYIATSMYWENIKALSIITFLFDNLLQRRKKNKYYFKNLQKKFNMQRMYVYFKFAYRNTLDVLAL